MCPEFGGHFGVLKGCVASDLRIITVIRDEIVRSVTLEEDPTFDSIFPDLNTHTFWSTSNAKAPTTLRKNWKKSKQKAERV